MTVHLFLQGERLQFWPIDLPISSEMYMCEVGRSVFESLFQIILIGVLSLSLGSIEMMGIPFFWIQLGFGSPAGQSLFTIWNSFQAKEKNQNGYISLTLARNEKIRPLYFIQLLELNKTKWSYFFIWAKISKIWPFSLFQALKVQKYKFQNMIWPYLTHFSSNWKNKTTLFCLTLKVG